MADDISVIVGVDYSEMTGLVKTTGQTKRALNLMAKEFANSGSQKNYMAGINKLVAAQRNLDKSARLSRSEIMKLGNQMKQEAQFASALAKSTDGLGQAYGFAGKRANRAGVLAQQAGYQFGDFAVQVQSGTNVMVAAGQQATQLVGTFSMLAKTTKGIMAFSALGVIIPILTGIGAAFMRTKEAADDSSLAIKAFEESLKTAKQETIDMTQRLEFLRSGFGTESEFALNEDFAAATAELDKLESRLSALGGPNDYFESEANRQAARTLIEEAIVLAKEERDLAEDALRTYRETLTQLEQEEFQRQENLRLQREQEQAAKDYEALADKTYKSQRQQLHVAKEILEHGEDSIEVARLRALYEGKALGLVDAELGSYIQMSLELREIAQATEASANSAERFSRALESAALAGQTLASLKFEFSAGGRAMSLYAGRGTASNKDPILDGKSIYDKDKPSRVGGATPFDQNAYLESLQKEANFKQTLVGMTKEQVIEAERRREIIKKIQSEGKVADEARIKTILATEAATRSLIEAEEQRQSTMDMVTGHIESAFMSMVDGSKSVEDAFKGMLRAILLEIYQQQVAKPLAQSIGNFLFPNANGNAFSGGNVIPFANGGVVSSATMFPMAGNQTGLMGEAGPEAIMPLKRGANGKLGVQMEGGGGNTTVVQNFNFSANGDDSVKKIIAQAAPQIANMTKKSIMDDRRRGGQMKATFG